MKLKNKMPNQNEEKKCEGNCPNTCKIHMGKFAFCTNNGCLCHIPPNASRTGDLGRVEKKCCDKCYSNYTSDDIPRQFYDACVDLTCKCHECKNACGYTEPYGFVPEADCPIHDVKSEKKGIDYTKDNIYDAIGRSDLKPTPSPSVESWEDWEIHLCSICTMPVDMPTSEEYESCQWENCSGGRYCKKHSLEKNTLTDIEEKDIPEGVIRIPPIEESWEERFDERINSILLDYIRETSKRGEDEPMIRRAIRNMCKEEIKSFIKQEIEKAYEEGYTEGYNQGENKGYSKGLKIGRAEGGPGEVITNY